MVHGQYLRESIFGDARNEMLQKIDAVQAIAARVRNGSAFESFSDYASAFLYACTGVRSALKPISFSRLAPFDPANLRYQVRRLVMRTKGQKVGEL